MPPPNRKNLKVEMTSKGKRVNDKFLIPKGTQGETLDNQITNAMVDRGDLPESRREIYPQGTPVQPTVSAKTLANPTKPVTVPEPLKPSIPRDTLTVARNVARDTQGFISAQSEEAKQLKELQATYGALNGQETLADIFRNTQASYGVTPESFKTLEDINLQLADMEGASEINKVRISSGNSEAQAQREITQEDRELAVRSATLSARAAVIEGKIETATKLAKDAVDIAYQDRTLQATNMLNQINMVQKQVDAQTSQLLEEDKRQYEAELATIKEIKDAVGAAMLNGASQSEVAQLTDPKLDDASKLALAQSITARGANQLRNLEIAQKQAAIASSNRANRGDGAPLIKNFGTDAAPLWKQFDPETGGWTDVSGLDGAGGSFDAQSYSESQNKLDGLSAYVDQVSELSSASGASGISKTLGGLFVGDTKYKRLENVIDTVKTNLLTLNTDPNIKKFFGPQMSNKDTELMTSAASTLNAERQSPADMQKEVKEIKDFTNRAKGWTYLGTGGLLTVTLTDPVTKKSQQVQVDYDTLSQAVKDGVQVSF